MRGLDSRDFRKLFLESVDLPLGLQMKQASLISGPDPRDLAFAEFGGLRLGFRGWIADSKSATIGRLMDARFVFPTEAAAASYLRASYDLLADGASDFPTATTIGDGARCFGPEMKDATHPDKIRRGFTIVFRELNVVVKLTAISGDDVGEPLEASMVGVICISALKRITATE